MRALPLLALAACRMGVIAELQADVVVPADVLVAHADDVPLVVVVRFEGEPELVVPLCAPRSTDVVVRLDHRVSAPEACLDYRVHAALLALDGPCEEPYGWPDRGRWIVGPLDAYGAEVPPATPLDPEVTGVDHTSRWSCDAALTTGSLTLAAKE